MKWERALPPSSEPAPPEAGDGDHLAPPFWGRVAEFAYHMPRMLAGLGPIGPRGPEDGPPVLVIPGFLANDRTTMDLRRALARAGWRAHPWLLGLNNGAKKDTMRLLRSRLEALYEAPEAAGRPVLVVGWSLGGMFARELAHRCPEKVRAVVTLGSPFSGDLRTNTNVRDLYERIAGHAVNKPPFERHIGKPPVPTLAIWSRGDGIVAPAAARGLAGEVDKAVEIETRHSGFTVDRPAMSRVAHEIRRFLAEVEGRECDAVPVANG